MNQKLLEKLMSAGKDPMQYGIWQPELEMEDNMPELEDESETLLSHLGEMIDMVETATTEEVLQFVSEILKIKWF